MSTRRVLLWFAAASASYAAADLALERAAAAVVELRRRPRVCGACGHEDHAPVILGEPA